MPGARRGFDPVFDPLAFPFCLCPALQALHGPGICYGARIRHGSESDGLLVWVPEQPGRNSMWDAYVNDADTRLKPAG